MIVWGGAVDWAGDVWGHRYNPSLDTWAVTSYGPIPRERHTAVWTGTEMIVWGGYGTVYWDGTRYWGAVTDSGDRYCACPNGTLYYRDADGDGYGNSANVWTACDGLIPAGYSANNADCDDASESVHPGTAEVCNGVDDDCNQSIDDAAPPEAVPAVALSRESGPTSLVWSPALGSMGYDVVRGSVGALQSSGGDFTVATGACLANDFSPTSLDDWDDPTVGQAFWYLVRAMNCGGAGTWNSGGPAQVGDRDPEIVAATAACP
jgi:hypothetical protein